MIQQNYKILRRRQKSPFFYSIEIDKYKQEKIDIVVSQSKEGFKHFMSNNINSM